MQRISAIVIAVFCLTLSAFAQTGGIKGRVKNLNGDGISGATVTARLNGKDIRSTTAGKKGEFSIDGLDAGMYNLVFDAPGYSAGVKRDVEVTSGKMRDLGDRLILLTDRGSKVILRGSVFSVEGYSARGAAIEIGRVNSDGSVRKLGETVTDDMGEFSFIQPEGRAKLRITATLKDFRGTKDIDVDSPMVYRFSMSVAPSKPEN